MASGNDSGRRTIWWGAAVFLAVLAVIVLRVSIPDTVAEPVAWAIAAGVPVLIILLARHRIRWRAGQVPERDEQQVDGERSHWASQHGWTYDGPPRAVDVRLARAVVLGDAETDSARQQVQGTHQGRSFTFGTWQVTLRRRPTKSRSNPLLLRPETHQVIVLDSTVALPAVWLWARAYYSFHRWPREFPLNGHGRNPLRVVTWTGAKGAALPDHWPLLDPVIGPFVQTLEQQPVLLAASGHRVSVVWQQQPEVAMAQQRLDLASSFASAMEHAVREGRLPHGESDPVGP